MLTGALGRRTFLQMLSGGPLALMAGCSPRPSSELRPFVHPPEAGSEDSLYFASALPYLGLARGVLVESVAGRPIKIDGNPAHPGSLGGSDIYMQAALMDLFDEKRPQTATRSGRSASLSQLAEEVGGLDGVHVLTRGVASPSLREALKGVVWHRYDPLWLVPQACERPSHQNYRLDLGVNTLVSFEQDFLGTHPDHLRLARHWAKSKARLHVLESTPTLTGGRAHSRLALPPQQVELALWALAARFGLAPEPAGASVDKVWLDTVEGELKGGRGLILAGETLSPGSQALALQLNRHLKAPLEVLPAVDQHPLTPTRSLAALQEALHQNQVRVLLILDGNPVYEVPGLASSLALAGVTIHHTRVANETSQLCRWVVPARHELESWGDLRAFDGTLSLVQPLIQPLHQSLSALELLALLRGRSQDGYALLRRAWRGQPWEETLRQGFLAGSQSKPVDWSPRALGEAPVVQEGPVLVFRPDASVLDGQLAGNPWLQECPRPFSKLVWGNAVLVGPQTAARLGVANGDLLSLEASGHQGQLPVLVESWQAEETFTVHFGYGRERGGYDVYPLRAQDAW